MHSDVIQASVQPGCNKSSSKMACKELFGLPVQPSKFIFAKLREPQAFSKLFTNGYFVTWPGELDRAPDAMHLHIAQSGDWIIHLDQLPCLIPKS